VALGWRFVDALLMPDHPPTRYARTADGASIAYQVAGDADVDLIYLSPWLSHVEVIWEFPGAVRLFRGITSFARAILMDPRGVGLSDRRSAVPDLETRAEDVHAVLDAADSDRAVLFGAGTDGGALCAFFAATFPDRVLGLILWNSSARAMWAPDNPTGMTERDAEDFQHLISEVWGGDERMPELMRIAGAVTAADDPDAVRWFSKFARYAASPGDAVAYDKMFNEVDYRRILPAIRVPTAVMYRPNEDWSTKQDGRYLAEHIPGATVVELPPGPDHPPYLGDIDATVVELKRFVDSLREEEAALDRVLSTVLFTDIVGSTTKAAEMGDRDWRALLDRHHDAVRALLRRYRGREVDTAGDGFLATFDGPARAVRCGQAICKAVRSLGLEVRTGVHTGEVEVAGDDVRGIAVHVGARITALAGSSEVLVSRTVRDLVAGSGLAFEDAGAHELKGVPGRWEIYRALPELAR
jgi:class 3 adenylate cyclase